MRNIGSMLSIILLIMSTACQTKQRGEQHATAAPNIIYILADDLGYGDLSCYGQEKFSSPHLDQLAREGIRFTRHYSGSTVCAPSRSVLMTGLHTGHTPIRGNREHQPEGQAPLPASALTLAEYLKEAGYVTGAFGKWGLGFPGSEGDPMNQGFDHFFGYNCQRYAHRYYPEYLWENSNKYYLEGNDWSRTQSYAPDLIQEKTIEFIKKHKDQHFFAYVPMVIPHAELLVPEDEIYAKYLGMYPEEPYVERPGADPAFFGSSGGLRGVKRDLYEGGIRVPFIVSWPGTIEGGRTSDHISAFWDVLPTLADLTGNQLQETDGISFLSELLGKKQASHESLYWEFHEQGGKQALLKGEWKAVRLQVGKDPNGPLELYNLRDDPYEKSNVASEYPELVQEYSSLMEEKREASASFNFGMPALSGE